MVRGCFHFMLVGMLAFVLAGCATSRGSNDYVAQTGSLVQEVPDWSTLTDGSSVSSLSDLIQSDTLSGLVQQAIEANPGLQQTLLTLRIREAEWQQARSDRLPDVDAGLSGSKAESEDEIYTGSISVSWELDLWQKIADESSAASKDVEQQLALYQAARDTLAADVMRSWLGLIADQHAIAIQQERLLTLESNETLILQRYRNGLGPLEDLDSARSSTLSARATLENYRESLAQNERALRLLLGDVPSSGSEAPGRYPAVLTPLAELPSQTLNRRPDLIAAYQAVEAADYRSSAAYKDLLPSISLEAALEDVADSPTEALLKDPIWTLLGQLTMPLFRGGELRAAAEAAELTTAQAYQSYRETLLTAVQEVEDAIGLERSLGIREQHISDALNRQEDTLTYYQSSYRSGLVDILDLLSVQQDTYDLKAQLDELKYLRLANRIDLGLALGLGVNP